MKYGFWTVSWNELIRQGQFLGDLESMSSYDR